MGEDNFKISNSNIQFIIIVIDNEFNSFVQKECNKMWHNNIDSICVHVLLQNDPPTPWPPLQLGGSVWRTCRGARDLRFWLGILLYI